jgi:RNase P subunit RPR2
MVSELEFSGTRNQRPVICAWCDKQLISYQGRKVVLNENDALDYDWACQECYEKAYHGEL